MFSNTAELYDLIYGQFKDYREESRQIAALLHRLRPAAESVLDVACGTGEHARYLAAEHGFRVDGIDIEPDFVRIAAGKSSGVFTVADMTQFDTGKVYDVVLCLFSAIGYVKTLPNVMRALECFRTHLADAGIIVLEPWFAPDKWIPGAIHVKVAEAPGIRVCRMSHSARRDRISVLDFQYLIGTESGIEHRRETHELGLFTIEELQNCITGTGLKVVDYDPRGLTDRGLIVMARA